MGEKERLEESIRKVGSRYADEIIRLVKELAGVDVRIKEEMDEIEKVGESLIRKHNDLTERINDLVLKSVEGTGSDESEGLVGRPEDPDHEADMRVRVEIRVVR